MERAECEKWNNILQVNERRHFFLIFKGFKHKP